MVTGLALFAFATRKDSAEKNKRVKGGTPAE
jgi:hypothetical protein